MRKLSRSRQNKVFGGVMGGFGEYTEIDPTVVRIGYILLSFITHLLPAIIVYIIACIVIPVEPKHHAKEAEYKEERK